MLDATFKLKDSFVAKYRNIKPPFGFNGLGELVYMRTYSRIKEDGSNEQWWETVKRVVEGTYRMQERHIMANDLGWNDARAHKSAQEMYDRIFNMKFLPPGRGLWAMGSAITEERGMFAALNNCAFVSTENIDKEFEKPFAFLMDASMLGVGVGFDTKGAGKIILQQPGGVEDYIIPDTREGWVIALCKVLRAFFCGENLPTLDYSLVRAAGLPIKGFGGVSSGPEPLNDLLFKLTTILWDNIGKPISVTIIVDIMNLIGKCVVAGNVRRCLPEGTLIHTSEGLIPIENIEPGMLAKTAAGYSIISELVVQGLQEVLTIKTQLGDFSCTARHRMAVMTSVGEYEWRRANELSPGDRLVFVDDITTGTDTQLPAWEYKAPAHSTTCVNITIPNLDTDIAWFIGLFHGDGYTYPNFKDGGYNAYVSVACDSAMPSIIERCQVQMKRFGVNLCDVLPSETDASHKVRSQSKQLSWYLSKNVKQANTEIAVPAWILEAQPQIRAAYLAGVFDADGCSKNRPTTLVATVYHRFAMSIQALYASLGIPARLVKRRENCPEGWQDQWYVNVVGEKSILRFEAIVAPYSEKYEHTSKTLRSQNDYGFPAEWVKTAGIKTKKHWSPSSSQMTTATFERCGGGTNGLTPIQVLDITPGSDIVMTYDISVPDAHEFVCQEGLLVHNTAEIAFGAWNDQEYLNLKNYEVNPHRADYGWTSNNSIFAEVGMDYSQACDRVRYNGEPGFAWLENMQKFSRMNGVVDNKDKRVKGGNPCLEQSLESHELCCLVETFPANHDNLADYIRTLKFAYLYAKTVTLGKTHWPETNKVMLRNRRIGCSMSGVAQFIAKNGLDTLQAWCEEGYDKIQYYDTKYSEWLATPRSIKTTSIKPSGTVSLLAGATPGMHYPESRTYIRRMRLSIHSDLVKPLLEAGYKVEPAVGSEESTLVVEIPVKIADDIRTVSEVSMWEQLSLAAFLQRYWADNQVSCTITFKPGLSVAEQEEKARLEKAIETIATDTSLDVEFRAGLRDAHSLKLERLRTKEAGGEGHQIASSLQIFQYQLKGISFLPKLEFGAYAQMPYEGISLEVYEDMVSKLKPLDFTRVTAEEAEIDKFCSNDTCEIPKRK